MPKQTRHSTAYSGVYFVELVDNDQSFFIRYKQNGKSFEERAGRSSQGWNAEKASFLRKERLSGASPLGKYSLNNSGLINEENTWTFSVIFEAYLRLRPDLEGRENDIYRFKNYIKEDFGDRSPSEVVPQDIERLRHKLQIRQLKPATVRHVLELLRRLANYAFKKKFCLGLSFKIKMPTVENQKTENLTKEQLETLLRVLDGETDKQVSNIVRLVLYTGLRRGEIFRLKWNDIDFYGKTINIISKKKEKCVEIPMNEMAEKVLAGHAHSEAKSEFVFPGRGGRIRTECKRPLLRIKKNAGLPDDFRLLQGLRHVYASMLASSGEVDMKTLQTLLTHKSPLMTQRYAHLREDVLKNSGEKMEQEEISIYQDTFEEKTAAYDEESLDQNREVSKRNLAEENFSSDEMEESVIYNVSDEEDLKENQHEIISEHILESSESVKFEETVQALGQSFGDKLSEVAVDDQHTETVDQSEGEDDSAERLEENEHLQDRLAATEAGFREQETEYAKLDVDPIKMEVDMDEIVSAEELIEAAEDGQNIEFTDYIGREDDSAERLEENEHLQDRLAATEAGFREQETEYAKLDVDPIKMGVDMDEIVSAEELIELTEELQVDEINPENIDYVCFEELTAENAEFKENMEGVTEEEDYQDYSEENAWADFALETGGDSVFKEDLFTETEVEGEISVISEEHGDSLHSGETPEDEIHINDEKAIQHNYWENEETDSSEESGETFEAYEGEFSKQDNGNQIYEFTVEIADSDYLDSEKQGNNAFEIVSDDFIQETETSDCIEESEEETLTSNADESFDDEVKLKDSPVLQNFDTEDDVGEEVNDNSDDIATKSENNVKIFENEEAINKSEQISGKNYVFLSKTHQKSEKNNSLKDVKINLELKTENEANDINSDSSSRSSISELKKELMSFSELIKSTPTKVKSSTGVKNP